VAILCFWFSIFSFTPSNLQFADSLYQQGDYYNSATEYERYLFYNPTDSLSPEIKLKLAHAYIQSNEINKAVKILQELRTQDTKHSNQAQIDLAKLYMSQEELFKAKIELNDLLLFNDNLQDSTKKEINQNLGYIALQEREPNDALNYFTQAQDSFLIFKTQTLTKLPKKNILLSQILSSIIPGTGEMYCGKYGWGILSLLVNSVSIYGTIYTYRHKQYLDASLIFSLLFIRFYNGSRNNAHDFAQAYNERVYQQRLRELNIR
jgi:predicted negative regulator of RcsB-dependent stress response